MQCSSEDSLIILVGKPWTMNLLLLLSCQTLEEWNPLIPLWIIFFVWIWQGSSLTSLRSLLSEVWLSPCQDASAGEYFLVDSSIMHHTKFWCHTRRIENNWEQLLHGLLHCLEPYSIMVHCYGESFLGNHGFWQTCILGSFPGKSNWQSYSVVNWPSWSRLADVDGSDWLCTTDTQPQCTCHQAWMVSHPILLKQRLAACVLSRLWLAHWRFCLGTLLWQKKTAAHVDTTEKASRETFTHPLDIAVSAGLKPCCKC